MGGALYLRRERAGGRINGDALPWRRVTAHPIEQVLEALERGGVRYLVVGGVAVVLHGHLRTTADLDLASLGFTPRAPVPAEQFADAAVRQGWIEEKGLTVFTLWSERQPGLEVDLFVSEPFDFEAAWSRRVTVQLDSTRATVAGLDDLLALKRSAGRPQDLADVAALELLRGAGGGP
jgi:predicted nucleotidyltransferase